MLKHYSFTIIAMRLYRDQNATNGLLKYHQGNRVKFVQIYEVYRSVSDMYGFSYKMFLGGLLTSTDGLLISLIPGNFKEIRFFSLLTQFLFIKNEISP